MRRLALLLATVPAMLLMGCFAMELDITVNDDGSGTQTMRLTFPAELLSAAGTEVMGVEGEVPSSEELQAEFEADPEMAALRDALEDA